MEDDTLIPICDDEYFEDDVVGLFVEFVKTVYGAETLDDGVKKNYAIFQDVLAKIK